MAKQGTGIEGARKSRGLGCWLGGPEGTDKARDHHRQVKLSDNHFEGCDPAGQFGTRQEVAVTQRRERDEALIDGACLRELVGTGEASRLHIFNGRLNHSEEQTGQKICTQCSVDRF